jgi:hypothetical protein
MAVKVRKVCENETGNGKGWHYFYETQETIDENISCPDHSEATTRDFTIIEKIEE